MNYRISPQRLMFPLFVTLLILFAVTRLQVFLEYNIRYIDTDQPYMWLGATDFAKGKFYEPRYYGQSYNTFLEALFAVPLVWLKIPVYFSLPAATHFLSAFPFLFTAVYLFVKGLRLNGIFVMGLLLVMPPHYDLLNTLPRGFVTGLFCCSFFVISFLHPANMKWVLINSFLAVAGYFINPNSVVVSAAFFSFVALFDLRWRRLSLIAATVVISALGLFLLFDLFYLLHPDYIKNPITVGISPGYFMENISSLDHRFAHVSPFVSGNCWPLLALLSVLGVVLAKTNRNAFIGFAAAMAVVLFSFCVGKTTEGSYWVFVSFSRMYLGIPLLVVLMLTFVRFHERSVYMGLIPVVLGVHKPLTLNERLAPELAEERFVGVRVYRLSSALQNIEMYRQAAVEAGARLMVVSHGFWLNNILAYGGPATCSDYPLTIETKLDKRYWVREALADSVFARMLLISTDYGLDKKIPRTGAFRLENFGYGTFLVDKNTMPTKQFCKVIDAFEDR